MPTVVISAEATRQNDDLIFLKLSYQGRSIEMTVKSGMTLLEMAQTVINHPFPETPDVTFNGDIEIVFHVDSEDYRIVDSATKL